MSLRRFLAAPALAWMLLAAFGLLAGACGKRDWPQPKLREDTFRIRALTATQSGGCVVVDCELAGAWQNLDSVRVMLAPVGPGEDCPTCPFVERMARVYSTGAAEFRRDLNRVVITTCDLDPTKRYRVQVLFNNIYHNLPPVVSAAALATPQ